MEGVVRILRRFMSMTLLMFALLLVVNIALLAGLIFKNMNQSPSQDEVVRRVAADICNEADENMKCGSITEDLTAIGEKQEGSRAGEKAATASLYWLGAKGKRLLEEHGAWMMLLGSDGQVVANYELPDDIPRSYGVLDAVRFSRHYLLDYPVSSWQRGELLTVVGYPKTSVAKYQLALPVEWVSTLPQRALLLLLSNVLIGLLLALLIGMRMLKAIRPLARGILALSREEPVHVEPKGVLGDLAQSINSVSEKLQASSLALKQRDEARSNWIAGISHDIRTPLSMVLGYASELEEHDEVPAEQRQQAGIIRQQGEKLRHLVSDLNLVSMLEYEMQPLHIKTLRLSALARLAASDLLNHGLDARFSLSLREMDERVRVQGDERLLLRAISNLLNNSIRHNPQGCELFLAVCKKQDLPGRCELIVEDSGRGVPEEELPKLLDLPYSSVRRRLAAGGHGLGLPMVARIAWAHQGRLELLPRSGGGLIARLELPCEE